MKTPVSKIFIVLSFFTIVILMSYCGDTGQEKKEQTPVSKSENRYLNHSDSARYVGMNQCRLCHQVIYDSFLETGMGKSFDHADKEKSSAKFSRHTAIYDKFRNFYYHPFWDGDSLKILEFRLKGSDTVYKRIERVDYIIGSGQHTNSHIYNTNGYLHQMPLTYYTQKQKWDLPPGFEGGFNTRFSRKIGLECMSCHNALPDFVRGSENKFNALPGGIDCERCHGPGSIHVEQRSTGEKIDTSRYIDYSIVNPGKLPIDLQFDVCQRCHLQGNTVLKDGKSFFDFKPGMRLSDHMTTFLPRYEGADEEFIMASHADRLKQSPCFIKSYKAETDSTSLRPYKNSLTCVTCHNPHISVKVTGAEIFNNACKNCHTSAGSSVCSENQSVRNKVGDDCVSCHMPSSGSIDIPHVSVHDHYIRKPLKKDDVAKVRKFVGLYAVNEKNPDPLVKAKAYIQQFDKFEYNPVFLDSAMLYLSDKDKDLQKNFEMLVHLYFIKQDFSKILYYTNRIGKDKLLKEILVNKTWDNENAWTLYRIGEAWYNSGNYDDAHIFYQRAYELAPFNPEFSNKLGAILMAQNNIAEAIVVFEKILRENPKFVPAMTNLGYASLLSGNIMKAEALYNSALKLDPDDAPLLMNVAGLYIYKKEYAKAKTVLQQLLQSNPKNERAKQVLEQLKTIK